MSDDRFTWSGMAHWFIDQFVFVNTGLPSASKLPRFEATDGQEPTAESRREEARKIDARPGSSPTMKSASTTSKSLDKEFWETF